MPTYFTRETRKALTGVECRNYECKASSSRLFLILCPLGLDVQLFCLATFLVSPHATTPPGHCLARVQHSLSPIPLENVESALTFTAPSMSLYRTLIYIPWDCLNSLSSAFLVKNSASVPPPPAPKKTL